MSDMNKNEPKKRKRRSFWEPDSDNIVSWLDKQTDLGTSLQLIIVDAMRKYGNGDVIKAHLNQREDAYYEKSEHELLPEHPDSSTIGKLKQMMTKVAPVILSPEEEVKAPGELNEKSIIFVESKDELVVDEPEFDIHEALNTTEEKDSQEEDGSYDPLEIMMRDSGSKITNE